MAGTGSRADGAVTSDAGEMAPEIWLSDDAPDTRVLPHRSLRRRMILLGVVVSVVAAFGFVAAGAFSRQQTVRTALASLFGSPTLQVVFSAQTSDPHDEAIVSAYSVVLTLTSENGQQPLSGSDGVDDFELSVLRSGTDLGDLLVADGAVYGRLNLQAISPSDFAKATASVGKNVPSGPANTLAEAFIDDQWVGVADSTIASFVKGLGASSREPNFETDRNAAALSFAQSWDTWASIREVSSSGSTTEYTLAMPVRNFVASFIQHLESALAKEVPSLARHLGSTSLLVRAIPASLTIPMTMWVTNGSLSQLDISYKGNSLDMAISHPAAGVSAPSGAVMLTPVIITSLENDFSACAAASSTPSSPPSTGGCDCVSATTPDDGGGYCDLGPASALRLELSFLGDEAFGTCSPAASELGISGVSGISSISGISDISGISGISGPASASSGSISSQLGSAKGWTGYVPLGACVQARAVGSGSFSG